MKIKFLPEIISLALCAFSMLNLQLATVHAQGTAFTYQGRLNSGGAPASGSYDLAFTLYPANTSGSALAGPVTNAAVAVSNGLFTTTVDFGAGVFTGESNWLEIAVSTNGANSFSTLAPRQQLTPTPYALYAPNAGSAATATTAASAGSVVATNIAGPLTTAQLPAAVVTNGASGVNLTGTFSGNGAGLTNFSATATNLTPTTTNFIVGMIDVSRPYQTMVTNAAFAFVNRLTNMSATAYNVTAVDVTNASGSVITITPAASWHTEGTWNCTNVTELSVLAIAGRYTNVIAFPLW